MTRSITTKKPSCGSATSIAKGPPSVILGEDARKLGAGDRFSSQRVNRSVGGQLTRGA